MIWFLCLVTGLYAVSFCIIFPILFKNLGFSVFFDSEDAEKNTLKDNVERTTRAFEYIKRFNLTGDNHRAKDLSFHAPVSIAIGTLDRSWPSFRHAQNSTTADKHIQTLCMVVVSVHRNEITHYLAQVIVKLLKEISKASASGNFNYDILIFNGDHPHTKNKDALDIQKYLPIKVYHQNHDTRKELHPYEKEKQDYVNAMKLCHAEGADYVLIIEDDALPADDFLNILDYILKYKLLHRNFAFMKLYYPERWQGFGKDEVQELIVGGCLLGAVFSLVILKLCKIEFRRFAAFNYLTALLLIVSLSIYFIVTAYTLGRQHILELLKLTKPTHFVTEAPGCCTPAVLYPHTVVKSLLSYLESVTCGTDFPLDIALDKFGRERNLQRYLVIPNMFYHIGYYSSIKGNTKDPREFQFLIPPKV